MDEAIEAARYANWQNSPLLSKLPPEIRNRVYRLVLVSPEPVNIQPRVIRRQRSLLKTCHQLREDASTIYYGENAFVSSCSPFDMFHVRRFLRSPGDSIGSMMSGLTIHISLSSGQLENITVFGDFFRNDNNRQWAYRMSLAMGTELFETVKQELSSLGMPLFAVTVKDPSGTWQEGENTVLAITRETFETQLRSVAQADSH